MRSDTETHHYGNFELEIKITWQLNGGNVIDLHVKVMGTRKNSFKVTEPRDGIEPEAGSDHGTP